MPYLGRYGITITMYAMVRTTGGIVQTSLASSFTLESMDVFSKSTTNITTAVVRKVAEECCDNVPHTKVRLLLMKSGYLP